MAAEKVNQRVVRTSQGSVSAPVAPNARQTYVPVPTNAAGQSARNPGRVVAVIASNQRQTHVT